MSTTSLDEKRRQKSELQPGSSRLLPHNIEAEESVLGAMLMNRNSIADASNMLEADDFYKPTYGNIFQAILRVHSEGTPADPITVADNLSRNGLLEMCGGSGALVGLQAGTPTSTNVAFYAEIVARDALARRKISALHEAIEIAYDGGSGIDPLQHLERLLPKPEQATTFTVGRVAEHQANPLPEPRPICEGLFRAGEIVGIAAPRSIGKTWFALQLARDIANGNGSFLGTFKVDHPGKVLYCHYETDQRGASKRWAPLFGNNTMPAALYQSFSRPTLQIVQIEKRIGDERRTEWRAELTGGLGEWIERERPDVVILDPWAAFFRGESNSNDQVQAGFAKLRAICEKTDCALVLIHHISGLKQGNGRTLEPEDLWRGATSLADAVAVRVTLTPHYTHTSASKAGLDAQSARRYVDVAFKTRNDREPANMSLVRDPETGRWSTWEPELSTAETAEEAAQDRRAAHRVALCRAMVHYRGLIPSIRAGAHAADVSSAVMGKALVTAEAERILEKVKDGYRAIGTDWWKA